jgi:DNA-binding NarL/FixJ family response regulator
MKAISPYVSLLLVAILLVACNSQNRILWPSLSNEAEEVCDSLEYLYFNDRAVRDGSSLMKRLDSLTLQEKNPARRARVLYWKSMTAHAASDSAYIWLHKARELTDSAKYPYMYARIVLEDKIFDHSSYLKRHAELRKAILFFSEIGDNMCELFGYRTLSSFYLHIGDDDGFKQCIDASDNLCKEMKKDSLVAKNQINYVLYYTHTGDTIKAKNVLDNLLENKYIRSDSDFMGRIYVNLGNLTSNPINYRRAIEISPTFRSTPEMRNTLEFAMMKTYESNGDLYHADSLLTVLAPIVYADGDHEAKAIMHALFSRQAKQRGDYKLALDESEISRRYFDSTFNSNDRMKVSQITFKEEIARQEAEYEHEHQLALTKLVASIVIMLLCCLIIWFYYKSKENKLLVRQYESEAAMAKLNLDLEKEKRSIAAMGLAMNERDNLIKEVGKIVDQMNANGEISSEAKLTIGRLMKLSQHNQKEWDNFQIAYSHVYPHFIPRLKERYPGISEGDTRLALYICAGLTSKQIAQAMHLQPDSVKKNRQRLRQRMKLSSEASLEEELRKMF